MANAIDALLQQACDQYEQTGEVDTTLIQSVWGDHATQTSLIASIAHGLFKTGCLAHSTHLLHLLARSLTTEQVLDFYQQLLTQSRRPDFEWRTEFEELFPLAREVLPVVDCCSIQDYILRRSILFAVQDADYSKVELLLTCMAERGMSPANVWVMDPEDIGLSLDDISSLTDEQIDALYQLNKDKGIAVLEYAQALGHTPIADLLRNHLKATGQG